MLYEAFPLIKTLASGIFTLATHRYWSPWLLRKGSKVRKLDDDNMDTVTSTRVSFPILVPTRVIQFMVSVPLSDCLTMAPHMRVVMFPAVEGPVIPPINNSGSLGAVSQ